MPSSRHVACRDVRLRHLHSSLPRRDFDGAVASGPLCAASHLRSGDDHVKCCAELKPAGGHTHISRAEPCKESQTEEKMAWTTPVIVEVCVGMEITSYEVRRNLNSGAAFASAKPPRIPKIEPARRALRRAVALFYRRLESFWPRRRASGREQERRLALVLLFSSPFVALLFTARPPSGNVRTRRRFLTTRSEFSSRSSFPPLSMIR